ncbi:MAG: exodeoxyribonuclease VII large subunit [Limisphaerales bacterium]
MPRKTNSGWDFGELFPERSLRRVVSVSELTSEVKKLLEGRYGEIWVSGEITNLRLQSSGHMYFALKDPGAQLSCVLFRGTSVPAALRGAMKDGQKVSLEGELTVYEPRGQYQLIVRAVEVQGVGALQAAFERLKAKLAAEGLFESGRKRPIPRFPRRLGVVTSPTGAALRDVLHVLGRRYAGLEVVLAPCRVQGQGAELEIAQALQRLNAWSASSEHHALDVILVTRGGGSLEDLWAFNEEAVARAIHNSTVPVVSAIGHEIDFTIADFVADLRAATPSAAAELLTEGYVESRESLRRVASALARRTRDAVSAARDRVSSLEGRLGRAHPSRRLRERAQRLDDLESALARCGREAVRDRRQRLERLELRLGAVAPRWRFDRERERWERLRSRLVESARRGHALARERLDRLKLRLSLLSPDHVLARGYSITLEAATGRVIRRAAEVVPGMPLKTRLHEGEVTSIAARPESAGS